MQRIATATVIKTNGQGLTVFEQGVVNREIQKMQEEQKRELEAQKRMTRMAESSISKKNRAKLAEFEKAEQKEIGKLTIAWAMFWYFVLQVEKVLDEAAWTVEDAAVSAYKRFKRMQKRFKKRLSRVLNAMIEREDDNE